MPVPAPRSRTGPRRENRAGAPFAVRRERLAAVVGMYAQAVYAGRIREAYQSAIEAEFAKLAALVEADFATLYRRHLDAQDGTAKETSSIPRIGRNVSLRGLKPVRMSKAERLAANRHAMDVLATGSRLSDADLDALRLYTGNGGLQVDSAGVLNQHYTSYPVVRFIWDTLETMGVTGGTFLEPGCGAGNFAGLKPSAAFTLVGFDVDPVAVAVAAALYPDDEWVEADVKDFHWRAYTPALSGAIGNIPFGAYSRYRKGDTFAALKPLIHDSFILHAIDAVRPGGVVALVSSQGTMDKKATKIRRRMVEMAHFVGAFRLPNTAFKANASTEVTTDVLFFQKRAGGPAETSAFSTLDRLFVETVETPATWGGEAGSGSRVAAYYVENPDSILGTPTTGADQFRRRVGVVGTVDVARLAALSAAPGMAFPDPIPAPAKLPARLDSKTKPPKLHKEVASAESLLAALKLVIALQQDQAPDAERDAARAALRADARAHVESYGLPAASKRLRDHYAATSDLYQLAALVRQDKAGDLVFSQIAEADTLFNTAFEPRPASKKPADLVLFCRQRGTPSTLAAVAQLAGVSVREMEGQVRKDRNVFFDPEAEKGAGALVLRYEYLGGPLLPKLAAAEKVGLSGNVAALRSALPPPLSADEIAFDLADINTYLPHDVAQAYVEYAVGGRLIGVARNWVVDGYDKHRAAMAGWGWKNDYAWIVSAYLNGEGYRKQPVAKDAEPGEQARSYADKAKNENKMRRVIPKRFSQWLRLVASDDLRQRAVDAWNAAFNSTIEPTWDGRTFTLPHLAKTWTNGLPFEPKGHQRAYVERALYTGSGVNSHGVGAGKTLTAIMLSQALRQRGLARKPLAVVPSKVAEKWIAETLATFPSARILNLKLDKKNRELALSMLQQNEYDLAVCTHEGFASMPASPELTKAYFEERTGYVRDQIRALAEQLDDKERANAERAAGGEKKVKLTQAGKRLKDLYLTLLRMEQKVTQAAEGRKDDAVYWDDLGVDAVFIDEAHNFKNYYLSDLATELGIGVAASSNRAEEAMIKLFHLHRTVGERNVFLLTATPTNNTPLEAYIFLQMVAPSYLRSMGIGHVDDFIRQFASVERILTLDMLGRAREKDVVVGYKQLGVLRRVFYRYVDYLDLSTTAAVVRPKLTETPVYLKPGLAETVVRRDLESRVERIKKQDPMMTPNGGIDNYLSVAMTGSRAAVDTAFYDPVDFSASGQVEVRKGSGKQTVPYTLHPAGITEDSKAGVMCRSVADSYWRTPRTVTNTVGQTTEDVLNGQIIFCDPITTATGRDFHHAIRDRLVALGVPRKEIAIVNGSENNTPEKKKAVQDGFNAGRLRVLIGGTSAMGEGMDLNRYCTHIHHLDVPWKPSELTQRNGRGHRQGNVNPEVEARYYLMKRSMDVYRYQLMVKKARWVDELWGGDSEDMEASDGETGFDYETVMMALQDDPAKIEALDLSRQMKRAAETYEYALEDVEDAGINLRQSRAMLAKRTPSGSFAAALEHVRSLDLPSGTWEDLVSSGRLRHLNNYGAATVGTNYVGNLPTYRLTATGDDGKRHDVAQVYISAQDRRTPQGEYVARFDVFPFKRDYQGSDRIWRDLTGKLMGALRRLDASWAAEVDKATRGRQSAAEAVSLFERRVQEGKADVTAARDVLQTFLDAATTLFESKSDAARFLDDRALAEYRNMVRRVNGLLATVGTAVVQGVAAGAAQAVVLPAIQPATAPVSETLRDGVEGLARLFDSDRRENARHVALTWLGWADALDVRTRSGLVTYEDDEQGTVMVWAPALRRLLLVPASRVERARPEAATDPTRSHAERAYEEWSHTDADAVALALDLPAAALAARLVDGSRGTPTLRARRVGTADRVLYRSDKLMEWGDRRGKLNGYRHDFDRLRRAVHEIPYPDGGAPVVAVSGLSIDGRGILN